MEILEYPYTRKRLSALNGPGVYLFTTLPSQDITGLVGKTGEADFATFGNNLLYIGKAKHLKNRLASYLCPSAGERAKCDELARHAQSLIVIPCASHFAASLLELRLIRQLRPSLNRKSKQPARLVYVVWQGGILRISRQPRATERVIGFLTSPREARHSLSLLAHVLAWQRAEVPLLPVRNFPFPHRAGLSVQERGSASLLHDFLLARRGSLVKHVEEAMWEASAKEQYRQAASLRDVLASLQHLQRALRWSRKLLSRFRTGWFRVESGCTWQAYRVEDFHITQDGDFGDPLLPAHPEKSGGSHGELPLTLSHPYLTSCLRINYEILRMMRYWYVKQIEPCTWEKSKYG